MQVRMKVTLSGTRDGESWPERGGTVDLPEGEALHMVAGGLAEPTDEAPPLEEATAPEPETSTPSRRRPSTRKS